MTQPTLCYDCNRSTSGACWRHSVTRTAYYGLMTPVPNPLDKTPENAPKPWTLGSLLDAVRPDMHREQILALVTEAYTKGVFDGAAEIERRVMDALDERARSGGDS